ncbi:YciI family protein [Pseudooceanicola onchidii]|uniref:YciI family protein n=1 Tax=Pseudooceanicola onchidii TaxID=2562279 RepID=UPI0010AA37EB|nr:YciI family protein [Pseudooceanicola onchidii]
MPQYLYIYRGDASQVPSTPEDQEAAMKAWGDWMGAIGPKMVNPGEPVGKSVLVSGAGVSDKVPNASFGFSIVEAATIEEACDMAKGNPMVAGGGSVEVAEIVPMDM